MNCPSCQTKKTKVIDSKRNRDYIRRRRICPKCQFRFTTKERYPDGAKQLLIGGNQ